MSGDYRHVLLPADHVGDGCHHDLAAEARLPEQLPGPRIERVKVALSAAGDIKITGNREKVKVYRKNLDGTKEYTINMLDINSLDSKNFNT